MNKRDRRKKRRRKKEKPRAELEKLVLDRVPIEELFRAGGNVTFMEGVPKLVGTIPTKELEALVRKYR